MKTMLDYINEIPEYISSHNDRGDHLRLHDELHGSGSKTVTIVASGSSNNAARCAYYGMRDLLGKEIRIFTPHTFVNCEKADPDSFYIVISQSGRSVNTLKVLEMLKDAKVTAHFITDNEEMKDDEYMKVYHLDVGNEEVPFVTKGMSATVFFLMRSAGIVFPDNVKDIFEKYQKMAEDDFEGNREIFSRISRIHIIGTGTCQGVALEGALKFCETLHIAASPYETEEFLHGGNFELQPDHLVIAVDGNDFDHERITQVEKNLHVLCDSFLRIKKADLERDPAVIVYLAYFQTLVYLMNRERGNIVPLMEEKYLEFEGLLKAKTINYYR